jgi:GNAT superfamily N-acetyltransferase
VIDDIEFRAEPPDGVATRALLRVYRALIQDRLGLASQPSDRVFAAEPVLNGDDKAWLVIYNRGRAVGCGGLRTLEPGVAEIKRMFVSQRYRRNGHGRRLLRELERIAVERGHDRVRLLTTEVLSEARRLCAAEGYRVVQRIARERSPVEIWLEKDVPDRRVADYS